jgi:AcrR family transcriptional regulator
MSDDPRVTHRAALLEAARELLRTRGYASITARDLVAASGTNLGSIGYHFGSKEALLNEAIGEALQEWADTIARTAETEPGKTPLDALTRSTRAMLDRFDEIKPYFLAFIEALARSARTPELARQLAQHYEAQRERVTDTVVAALGARLDRDTAASLAALMIAVTDGLLLQYYADPDRMYTRVRAASELQTALSNALRDSCSTPPGRSLAGQR